MRLSRLYYVLFITLGSFFLASCSDDDDNVVDDGVKVLSAETSFDANGGTKEISVNKNISKAYAADNWLSVETKGSSVAVSTGQNVSNESRHTTVVIKASETDSTIVNVSQLGSVFVIENVGDIVLSSNAATSMSYSMKHQLPVEVSVSDEWISVNAGEDNLKVDVAENNSGHLRHGWVAYACGSIKDTINVVQYDFNEDIAGNYYFGFTQASGKAGAVLAQLGKTSTGYALNFPALGYAIPVSFDAKKCQLSLAAGSYLGDYDYNGYTLYIYDVLGNSSTGSISWDPSDKMDASFDYDEENGTYAIFEGSGVDFLSLFAFSEKEPSEDAEFGSLLNMFFPYMQKLEASASAKKHFTSVSKLSIMK